MSGWCVIAGIVSMSAATEPLTVDGGRITGVVDRDIRVYKGIPYAAPPTGDLRWKPPGPVVPWSGVRDASSYGAECPQTQYQVGSIYVRPLPPQSEDCLLLNVWTAAKPGEKRPVLVWIHGGALTRGSSTSDVRDGVPLASKGIVLVSIRWAISHTRSSRRNHRDGPPATTVCSIRLPRCNGCSGTSRRLAAIRPA
jgi:para-nitrobenzyl esterase